MPEAAHDIAPITHALVRPPGPAYIHCIREDTSEAIDFARALDQHAAYCQALAACGLKVLAIPPAPDLPDACFVEDVAIIVGNHAIITRPGASQRQAEVESVAEALSPTHAGERIVRGAVDGGDVIVTPGTVFVGRSGRTNQAGIDELRVILARLGRALHVITVEQGLHLKSDITAIGPRTLVQRGGAFDPDLFDGFEVCDVDESKGGNVVVANDHAVVSTQAPKTAQLLRHRGLEVHTVDLSEFHKGDACGTCLSVLF